MVKRGRGRKFSIESRNFKTQNREKIEKRLSRGTRLSQGTRMSRGTRTQLDRGTRLSRGTHFERYANSKNVFKMFLDLPIQSSGDFKYLHFFGFC